MPSVAIYGDSGMGKTMIMEKFRLDHPPDFDPDSGKARTPVLALQMSGKPSERRLYAQLLTALGAPHNPRATIVDLEQKAINLLKDAHIKVLVDRRGPQHPVRLTPRPARGSEYAEVLEQRDEDVARVLRRN